MNFPFSIVDDRPVDALGFGTNAVDFLVQVPSYPEYASKIELTEYVQLAGGEIATAMAGLTRLGLRTMYAGRFGDDDAGNFGIRSLNDEGVDTSLAEQIAGATTQIAFIIIDEQTGERTVIWKRDKKLAYRPEEAPVGSVGEAKVLHLFPHDVDACIALAREAKDKDTVVSIDLDNDFGKLDELLPLVDILITSADFPGRMFGIKDKHEALKALKNRFGSAVAGITLGDHGSLMLCGETFIETKGFAVPGGCKDTTGAGDSFRAGFLYGVLTGESVEEAARMANAVAALKCRAIGARTALPSKTELYDLLKKS
jgi:sugar/nucleoside kinase (ribokinase family)